MAPKRTDLQLFDQLITTHALPTYSQMKYGRIAYLFAHIHALQELNIITENYMHNNFSEFCRHLQQITHDNHLSRSKAHIRHIFVTKGAGGRLSCAPPRAAYADSEERKNEEN